MVLTGATLSPSQSTSRLVFQSFLSPTLAYLKGECCITREFLLLQPSGKKPDLQQMATTDS
jgi:hypothetical protein